MKVQLLSVKYNFRGYPIQYENLELECNGMGTKDNPVVIDSFFDPKLNIEVTESDIYIIFKGCTLKFLNIYYCTNISIINCELGVLDLRNCSNIHAEEIKCSWLKMVDCYDCRLFKLTSTESETFYKCYNNIFEECVFGNFIINPGGLSRNNILKNNEVFDPEEIDYKLLEAPIDTNLKPTYRIDGYANSKGSFSWEVECTGKGISYDPIIIDSLDSIPFKIKTVDLFHIREHVILRNIFVKNLGLYDVKNTLIEKSIVKGSFRLKFCQDLKIMTTSAKKLELGGCKDIYIQDSEFNEIKSLKGLHSEFKLKNTSYKKMDEVLQS